METFTRGGDAADSRQKFSLGRIVPIAILICFLLDISLRFLPPERVAFRAWEAATLFATANGPFAPGTVRHVARASGDLAAMANLPRFRQFREETFTTDAAGYRNRGEVVKPFTGILLTGDSFAAGSGVSDGQTLSEQLADFSGRRVYNGSETHSLEELLSGLEMTRGLVIWQQSEREVPDVTLDIPGQSWGRIAARNVVGEQVAEGIRQSIVYGRSLAAFSPVQILLSRVWKRFQDDRVFPNPYRTGAVVARLKNGRQMLFLPEELRNYEAARPADPRTFVEIRKRLTEKGLGLLVVLVPDKYVVYRNLLVPAPEMPERQLFLSLLEQRLVAAKVPVLNMTPLLRRRAEALLPRDEYLYWRDDTHWNAAGIRETAEAIAATNAVSGCPCQ